MTGELPCQGNLQQIAEHGEPGAVRIIVEALAKTHVGAPQSRLNPCFSHTIATYSFIKYAMK